MLINIVTGLWSAQSQLARGFAKKFKIKGNA